jgi:hypothetical protein
MPCPYKNKVGGVMDLKKQNHDRKPNLKLFQGATGRNSGVKPLL